MWDLSRLLRPKSIAVVGGGVWCRSVIEQCEKIGFQGPLWPVHTTADYVVGHATFRSVEDLPSAPDATFIGVNRHATVDIVKTLSQCGGGGAVCFASGFLEAQAEANDGAELQSLLIEGAGDMPIIGPNCYGVINYLDGAALWPDQHGGVKVESGVALITQSSNMAINISMQQRGLPLAYMVTVGNQAQIGFSEIGRALLRDERVTALGLHIEGIGDIPAFEALAGEARKLGKGIVAIKIGLSEQAQAATISHTASLAGSDAGARAVLQRLGIARVDGLPELLETLKLLHVCGPLSGNRVASMSCSGGEASLMADTGVSRDIVFPDLKEVQKIGLRYALGPMVALANPLDYHTYIWGDAAGMGAAFSAMMQGELDIGCLIVDFPRSDLCSQEAWNCVLEAAEITTQNATLPLALVASLPENMPEDIARRLMAINVIPLCGLSESLTAIEAASFIGQSLSNHPEPILQGQLPINPVLIDEAEAKDRLSAFGLAVPKHKTARARDEVLSACSDIGFPAVLKARGLAHKSESDAVKLGLISLEDVDRAAKKMNVEDFLLEEMVTDGICELLIGVTRDRALGFVLTIAAGGVLTELLNDQCSLILPVDQDAVLQSLDHLKTAPLLKGYRGKPRADYPSIIKAVMALQAYVLDHAHEVEEIEINPLIVTPDRAIAADALIRQGDADVRGSD
ncbi:MAG: acetate--CoA ligase family protein [Paracoccaceae bacterium]|nr:acetate--CoA ligase family protein [Paracoccaceae bacterium]